METMTSPEREQALRTFRSMAEAHVETMQKTFGATLCYDEGSIYLLDDLISRKGITPEDENFNVIIMTVGSYLGETLIRVLGGRWGFDEELEWVVVAAGEKVSPFMLVIRKFTVTGAPSISEWYEEFKEKVSKEG